MRIVMMLSTFTLVSGCAQEVQPDARQTQEAACTAAIAAHVNRPPAEVSSRWISESAGIARVEARDGDRIHVCEVDGSARVVGYEHPGAE